MEALGGATRTLNNINHTSSMGDVWNVILTFSSDEFWHEGEDEARKTCAALDALNKLLPPDGQLVDLTHGTFRGQRGDVGLRLWRRL